MTLAVARGSQVCCFSATRSTIKIILGVDISSAVGVACEGFTEIAMPGDFLRADISNLDIPDYSVNVIFSEGVLHHADSTEPALKHLAKKLVSTGDSCFMPTGKRRCREFTDDAIRDVLKPLSDGEAWEALKFLARLGIVLRELACEIRIKELPFWGSRLARSTCSAFSIG